MIPRALLVSFALVAAACGVTGDVEGVTTSPANTAASTSADVSAAEPAATTIAPLQAESLTIWSDRRRVAALTSVGESFTAATGVEVVVVERELGQIQDAVTSGVGPLPDLFVGISDWTGDLAARGAVAPIPLGNQLSVFAAPAVDAFGAQNEVFAVPYQAEAAAFVVNTDLAEVPVSIEDAARTCEEVRISDEPEGTTSTTGATTTTSTATPTTTVPAEPQPTCFAVPADTYHQFPFLSALGGYVFGFNGGFDAADIGVNTSGSIAGAIFIDDLVERGLLAPASIEEAKALFVDQLAPYWIAGPWELAFLEGTAADGAPNVDFGWTVVPIPLVEGLAPQPFVGGQGVFVSARSESLNAALTFATEFLTLEASQRALWQAEDRSPALTAIIDSLAPDAPEAGFAASMMTGVALPNIPEMGLVWEPLDSNVLALRRGEKSPQQALADADSALHDVLDD